MTNETVNGQAGGFMRLHRTAEMDFEAWGRDMVSAGMLRGRELPPRFAFPDARGLLERGMRRTVGDGFVWQPAYDELADWMRDTRCRGLLLIGGCGQGKTVFAAHVLPVCVNWYYGMVVNVYDAVYMMGHVDEVLASKCVVVDDVGTEGVTNHYGQKRVAFADLVDSAEKGGKLLVVTSNLTTRELAEKYGERTVSRLMALTRCVAFNGRDMRKESNETK